MFSLKYAPLLGFQIVLMILFFIFVSYGGDKDHDFRGFEDIHVMIFVGFGFLMTFLKQYCFTALGVNFLLAALAVQWALFAQNVFDMENLTIFITKKSLAEADIMSATVLITFGALLGYATPNQLLFISVIEVVFASVNFYIMEHFLKAADIGGSMAIHAFGAYFGLGLSAALGVKNNSAKESSTLNSSSYISDVTAMIGTLFLFIYWPSFNAGLAISNTEYQRAVLNTYLSIASATVTTFVVSSMVHHKPGKFDMVHIQNSTLAGGVAIGSVANMFVSCGGAIAIGIGAGVISVLGYRFLTPVIQDKFGVRDTCGVHNLHGMPAVYSGILSILFAAMVTKEQYGSELENIFPAMNATESNTSSRTASDQALHQFLALIVTLAIAVVGGLITGFIIRVMSGMKKTDDTDLKYSDEPNWDVPSSS